MNCYFFFSFDFVSGRFAYASSSKMKRKHGIDKFPHILDAIDAGRYTVREPKDKKKYYQAVTWKLFRFIYDENNDQVVDHFFCSQCRTIFHLNLGKSGQCLKRHAEKCTVPPNSANIDNFFVPELHPAKRSKISKEDKLVIRDAAMAYIVRDVRPISAINGEGMSTLISKLTYIGAKYGHISEEALPQSRLIPSPQTVRN